MLLGTTLGTKLVGDAQLALEARSVDTEMTENLERIFAELPTMYSNLEGCDESTIKAKWLGYIFIYLKHILYYYFIKYRNKYINDKL